MCVLPNMYTVKCATQAISTYTNKKVYTISQEPLLYLQSELDGHPTSFFSLLAVMQLAWEL